MINTLVERCSLDLPVRVLLPDGQTVVRSAGGGIEPGGTRLPALFAVVLGQDEYFNRELRLPALDVADRNAAIRMEVQAHNPFADGELVWGERTSMATGGGCTASVVMSSRTVAAAAIDRGQRSMGVSSDRVEVWAFDEAGFPVVIAGFGETFRIRQARRRVWLALTGLACGAVLLLAIAAAPTAQRYMRLLQARAGLTEDQARYAPALAQRDDLARMAGLVENLRQQMGNAVEPVAVLEFVTGVLPDDTWIQRLQVQGRKVSIAGQTGNGSALMNLLSGMSVVQDVRALGQTTKAQGGKENFSLEFVLRDMSLVPPAGAGGAVAPAQAIAASASASSSARGLP